MIMAQRVDICSLDYLVGTIATAYKGTITSLVVKDFCITEENGATIFTGTFLSIPEGKYRLSLMHGGIEIENTIIRDGFFEMKVKSSSIEGTKNLQLDLVQNGKHIGTILLKKETTGGFYSSVLELSHELKGINFRLLNDSVKEKKGLQKQAESIISDMVSTKKDWKKLSENINSFSRDIFWYDRKAYYLWYKVLCRFAGRAFQQVEPALRNKILSNCLSLVELPLEKETDEEKVHFLVNTWIEEIKDSSINLSLRYNHAMKVLKVIHKRLPLIDVGPIIRMLLSSFQTRITTTASINNTIIRSLEGFIDERDSLLLEDFSEKRRKEMALKIIQVEKRFNSHADIQEILERIDEIDVRFFDDVQMVNALFEVIAKNIERIASQNLSAAFMEVFTILDRFSSDAYKSVITSITKLMKKLTDSGMTETCEVLLGLIEEGEHELRDTITFNEDLASSFLKNTDLLQKYKGILKQILIPPPKISGFSDETWAEIENPLHLKRISGFLTIVKLDFEKLKDILIHLICNLSISGVFIPDGRLFQREISAYLNARPIDESYRLHYMLLKKFPVYFHDVGASGRIRDLTTDIDSWGNDPVIYFMRKQVHVNASNYNIALIEHMINAWVYDQPDFLEGVVPEDIFKTINKPLLNQYSLTIRPLFESLGILDGERIHFKKILRITDDALEKQLNTIDTTEEIGSKVSLICRIYKDIVKKYALVDREKEERGERGLSESIERLKALKHIVTSPEKTTAVESFYFKRHIAFGIPSVIGTYHEPKFDAFGKTLGLEEGVRVMLERIILEIENKEKDFSPDNLKEWIYCLEAVHEIFRLHDLENFQIDEVITSLKLNQLHLSQMIDMLRIWQRELTWRVEEFYRIFHSPLINILNRYPADELPDYLRKLGSEDRDFHNKAADILIRNMLNSIVGFEELDRILNSLIKAFTYQVESGSDQEVNLYHKPDVTKDYFILDELTKEDAMRLAPFLGSKAKNLVYLHKNGLPVSYGVVLSAKWTKNYSEYIESDHFRSILKDAVKNIENKTGAIFGDEERPLFLSVRSGSYVSMPGILSSILYCGINKDTLNAFSENTGNPWLAWDSYRRFIEHYAEVVLGAGINRLDDLMKKVMDRYGVKNLQALDAEGMKEIVHAYLDYLLRENRSIPEDAYEQLKESVKGIYRSWYGEKAVQFRRAMNVSEHWGTSVTLMEMIQGNERDAGASVFFTRKPVSLEKGVYGETREMATGDDLVYGRTLNRPLSRMQAFDNARSLEEVNPELFKMHEETAEKIERTMGGLPQEVEATYVKRPDGGKVIYVLQTKRMEFHRGFVERFQDICKMESSIIGRGIGVHGGALNGIVTFSSSPERVKRLRKRFSQPIILLRKETSTDDVSLMPEIDGIITAVGGATSHAAILSQKFDLTAVVGCSDMSIEMDESSEPFAMIGDYRVREGLPISIDGSTGLIYSGICMLTAKEEHF